MGRFICRFDCDGEARYLEWSTVVDAPVTFGMPLAEFEQYYRSEYGEEGMRHLPERMERVKASCCSARATAWSLDELIKGNRAGYRESELSHEQIVDWYCRRREEPSEEAG